MAETILASYPGAYRVPQWLSSPQPSNASFSDFYQARIPEFNIMSRSQLRNEVSRLRLQIESDGRLYITRHHAEKYAAQDLYLRRFRNGNNVRILDDSDIAA